MKPYELYKLADRIRLPDELERKEANIMFSLRGRESFYLNDLKPGMVTAEPVLDRGGNRLLNSDITLDESKIEKLKIRGISSVRVKSEERLIKM